MRKSTDKIREQDRLRQQRHRRNKRRLKYGDDLPDHRKKYNIGDMFLGWIIKEDLRDHKGLRLFSLICNECGKQKSVKSEKMHGLTPCSHSIRDRTRFIDIKPRSGTLANYLDKIRHGAKKRKLNFSVSLEDVIQLFNKQNHKCPYTNMVISFQDGTASLDRINGDLGYINGNLQWVYKPVNFMKNAMNHNDFIELCSMIHKTTIKRAGSQ